MSLLGVLCLLSLSFCRFSEVLSEVIFSYYEMKDCVFIYHQVPEKLPKSESAYYLSL